MADVSRIILRIDNGLNKCMKCPLCGKERCYEMKEQVLMTDKQKRDVVIYDILVPSIRRLYEEDYFNIRAGVSERNICARLTLHIEKLMRECNHADLFEGYYVDVEYNRMGYGSLKYYEDHKQELRYMVSDLLIHSRGRSRNYLAVEMKRKGNYKNAKDDRKRLEALVKSRPDNPESNCVYGTLVGAYITYSSDEAEIELFEDYEGHGKNKEYIRLDCSKFGPKTGSIIVTRIVNNREELFEIRRYS